MKKGKNLSDFGDLCVYAMSIGIDYNLANTILAKDNLYPSDGNVDIYLSDVDQYGYSEDTIKILVGYAAKHDVTEFTICA